jgi:hypothetical protein
MSMQQNSDAQQHTQVQPTSSESASVQPAHIATSDEVFHRVQYSAPKTIHTRLPHLADLQPGQTQIRLA